MAAHGVSRKKSRVVGEPVKTLFGPWDAPNYVTPIMVIITIKVNMTKCSEIGITIHTPNWGTRKS